MAFYVCLVFRFVLEPATYGDAEEGCLGRNGAELVTIDFITDAIEALSDFAPVAISYRLDAEHNETCFNDEDGNKIDLAEASALGLALDFEIGLDLPQTLSINPVNKLIASGDDNATMATVCQYKDVFKGVKVT